MNYTKEISSGASVMTVSEFYEAVRTCMLSDYDGFGYASNGTQIDENEDVRASDVNTWKLRMPEYSHVAWFNK